MCVFVCAYKNKSIHTQTNIYIYILLIFELLYIHIFRLCFAEGGIICIYISAENLSYILT